MTRFILLALLLVSSLMAEVEEKRTGGPYFFKSYVLIPGFPRPKTPMVGPENEALKRGEPPVSAYVEAYYSPTGRLRMMQKIFNKKVLWRYEFIYIEGEVSRIIEYDSRGKPSVYYDAAAKK